MKEVLTARDMAALNEVRRNPGISAAELQRALDLQHKTQATRLLSRLKDFGFIGRCSEYGVSVESWRGSHIHQAKAAA